MERRRRLMANNVGSALNTLLTSGRTFYAPLADKGNGEVSLIASGAGASQTATFTRATVAWTKLSSGLWAQVASGTARSCYLGADTAVGSYGGYLAEGAGTQLVTPTASIRDMTNAAWVKGATMTAALTGTGIDGAANSCSRLTGGAVAATNTAFQTLVAAATSRTYSCFIKRVTGTGVINITQNGGTGYTDITSQINSSTFTRVSLNASVLNAAFGIQIVTSGDVILVDFNQFESGAFATSPMASAGAARNADVLTYPFSGNALATVGTAYAEASVFWSSSPDGLANKIISFTGTDQVFPLATTFSDAATVMRINDSTNGAGKGGLTSMLTGVRKRGSSWGGAGIIVTGDGATVASNASFDGDIGSVAIGIGCSTAGGNNWFGTIRNVRIYSAQLSAAQLSAVTA